MEVILEQTAVLRQQGKRLIRPRTLTMFTCNDTIDFISYIAQSEDEQPAANIDVEDNV